MEHKFYIQLDDQNNEKMGKTAGLLAALRDNYGVTTRLFVEVVTDKVFLVPMLKELENKDAIAETAHQLIDMTKADVAAVAEIEPTRKKVIVRCLHCQKEFEQKRRDNWTCSKACYQAYQRKSNPSGGKKTHSPLPNQAKIDESRSEEEARIEAVVAKAKLNAPSADYEHKIKSGGAIMARKL